MAKAFYVLYEEAEDGRDTFNVRVEDMLNDGWDLFGFTTTEKILDGESDVTLAVVALTKDSK